MINCSIRRLIFTLALTCFITGIFAHTADSPWLYGIHWYGNTDSISVGQSTDVEVQLPPILDDVAPTEIIVLGSAGQMYQVTTSTGRARPLALVDDNRSRFAATDDAVVIWNDLVDTIAVLRRGRDPIELPIDPGLGLGEGGLEDVGGDA